MHRSVTWLALFLSLALSGSETGCVSFDLPYTMRQKWDNRIGLYTYAEMVRDKGKPHSQELLPDGSLRAKWKTTNLDFRDVKEPYISVDSFVLTFDRTGVLQNWDYYR